MPGENDNGERLAKMEGVIEQMSKTVENLNTKFDTFTTNYVTRLELSEMFRARDKEVQEIKDKQNNKASIYAAWASVVVSLAAVGVAIVAIIATR